MEYHKNLQEKNIYNAFMQSPVAIGILKGKDYVIEFANEFYLSILGKDSSVIGKSIFAVFPELKTQGLKAFMDKVVENKAPYHVTEHEFLLERNNVESQSFFNCDYQPLKDNDDTIIGLIVIFTEVTKEVLRKRNSQLNQNELKEALQVANTELIYQNKEKGKRAAELVIANEELDYQTTEKQHRADELVIANEELDFQNIEKQNRANELVIANAELDFQTTEKKNRADELAIANEELDFQNIEKQNRANELAIANAELDFQTTEKKNRADELAIANAELDFQNIEKQNRANELAVANVELDFQNAEKQNRADELAIANVELDFQNTEKQNRVDELAVANTELDFQISEKKKRADELIIANEELIFQNTEKKKRAAELVIANEELYFQNIEKNNRATELLSANKEIAFSKYNKIFLTEFSEKFSGNNVQKEFFNSLVKFISDITKLDYAFVAKFKNQAEDTFTLETIAVSALGKPIENFDYSLIDGPCKQIIHGTLHTYAENAKSIFPKGQILLQFNVDGYIGVPLYNSKGHTIGLIAVMHATKIEDVDTVNSILKITAKRTELEFERIANEENLTSNNKMLEEKNFLLVETNKLLLQKNKEIEQANEKLLNEYSRSLIEASHDPLVTIGTDGKIMDMNEAMVEVSEKSRAQLKGTDFKNYFTDKEKAKTVYQQVFEKGFVTDYPLTMIDGKLTDVLFNGSVYKDAKGKVQGAVVVARDVSEQKKIENDLLQSLKEVSDYKYALDASSIVEVTDEKGIIKYVNENFCKISQYSSEELIGHSHLMINSGYHSKELMNSLWDTISSGKIWRDEIKNKAKDGSYYWVLTTIVPFLNKDGKPYQYVAIRTDITDQKRIEQELTEARIFAELATGIAEEAKEKAEVATSFAEEAVKSKQQFLSNMSHEIRTPMNAIIGFTKVVLKTELTPKQKEYISAIKMSGDALIVLINDILDIAKVDAGKMTFEKVPFKLALSVDAMLHLFETKILEKNLTLIKDYDKNIPAVLMGDSIRLHQIILNLVSNALKFTEYGSITVAVKLVGEDADKVTVEFSITDTGIGIKEEKLQSIFENFTQATAITSRLYGGSGLGLAIVKQLVDLQGGNVTVKSTVDEGSTFSFILNFDKSDTEEIVEPEIMELDETVKDIKILVVEDMPLNQLLMKTLLDDFGFESDITANGKLALEKLATKTYDIILMDLQMPEMNGFEATEYIRNTLKSNIPIVALTADVTTVDVAKCKAVGMNDYIAKPVDERLLYSKIVSLVKKPVVLVSKELLIEAIEEQQMIKCIDLKYLNTRTKSNPALMMQMMQIYLEQTPPLITLMTKSFAEKDWHNLDAAVHKMIPSFAIMGMHKDYEAMAKKIQAYAVAKQGEKDMQHLITQLENILGQSCRELEIEFNHMKNTNL